MLTSIFPVLSSIFSVPFSLFVTFPSTVKTDSGLNFSKILKNFQCIIIDNYNENVEEKLLYSILNETKQLDNYVVINSNSPIKDFSYNLKDLKSRAESFVNLGIELPTDDLLRVIITKYFSDKQIKISPKISEYIIKNIERSYEKIFKFIKEIDDLSLSSGKSININLIKKVLNNE